MASGAYGNDDDDEDDEAEDEEDAEFEGDEDDEFYELGKTSGSRLMDRYCNC